MSQLVSNNFLQQAPADVDFPENVSATGLFYDYKNYLSSKTTINSGVPLVSYKISIEPSDKSSSTSTYKEFDVTDSLDIVSSNSSILEIAIVDISSSAALVAAVAAAAASANAAANAAATAAAAAAATAVANSADAAADAAAADAAAAAATTAVYNYASSAADAAADAATDDAAEAAADAAAYAAAQAAAVAHHAAADAAAAAAGAAAAAAAAAYAAAYATAQAATAAAADDPDNADAAATAAAATAAAAAAETTAYALGDEANAAAAALAVAAAAAAAADDAADAAAATAAAAAAAAATATAAAAAAATAAAAANAAAAAPAAAAAAAAANYAAAASAAANATSAATAAAAVANAAATAAAATAATAASAVVNNSTSNLKYEFINLNKYKILHTITYKETGASGKIYKNYHIQNFTYYETPVSITDFTFNDNVANSDTLVISNLKLNHGLNVSGAQSTPIDTTQPEGTTTPTTKSPVIFTFQEAEGSGNTQNTQPDELLQYSKSYDSSGSYDLTDIQLTAGKVYKVTAQFSWALGYTAFSRSTQNLYILSRPKITAIDKKPLSTDDSNNIVMDITMDGLVGSGVIAAPSKVWFEFYNYVDNNNAGTLVARAGGDPNATNPVTGIVATGIAVNSNNVYPLKLNEIAILNNSGGLLNGSNYAVKAVVRYEGDSSLPNVPQFRYSNVFGPLNFPTISPDFAGWVMNGLYVADSSEKIITISVKNSAYYLYAPLINNAARFHFYDPRVEPPSLVATTSNFTFKNDYTKASISNQNYEIKLSDISVGDALFNDVEYLIRMEVDLTKHNGTGETRKSPIDTTSPYLDRVTFTSTEPYIQSLTGYDAQVDGSGDSVPSDNPTDSSTQKLISINVRTDYYELVAPYALNGIRFIIYDSTIAKVATTSSYTFVNIKSNETNPYNVHLNEISLEPAQPKLSNGVQYYIKAAVSIVLDDGTTIERLSTDATSLKFTQEIAAISQISVKNTWDAASNGDPSSYSDFFNNSPKVGITAYFNKTDQFHSGATGYTNQLDVTTTKFKVEYKVGTGNWVPVKKAVLIQQLVSDSNFQAAVNRATSSSISTNADGLYNNIVGSGNGTSQLPMILYIPQNQEETALAFSESENDRVKLRVSIYDPTGMWNNSNTAKFSEVTESSNLYVINKIKTYDYSGCSDTEPYNTTDNNGVLQINIPVNWDSIYAHSVKVGIKYSSGAQVPYTYDIFGSFLNTNNTTFVTLPVNPTTGTTLYYSVAYIVSNLNNGPNDTDQGLTTEKNVRNKAFPTSSDYTITSTSYKTFNSGSESSISFDLTFQPDPTRRIDGVNVYFTSPDTTEGSNITKTRIGTYLATNGGTKTIRLLYTNNPSMINSDANTNNTKLNILNSAGAVIDGSVWGDFDMANISFDAYRDRRVSCSSASYGSINYIESGSSDFNKVIWNVPTLSPPSIAGSITLAGGIINSSTSTILNWVQASNINSIPYKYDVSLTSSVVTSTTQTESLLTTNSLTLNLDEETTDTYTIELYKVFDVSTNGSSDEKSLADIITFCSIKVETTDVGIQVVNPSDTSKVNVTFNDSVIIGNSVIATGDGVELASFSANVTAQYLAYTKTLTRTPFTASDLVRVADVTALTATAATAALTAAAAAAAAAATPNATTTAAAASAAAAADAAAADAADAASNKESVPIGGKKKYNIPIGILQGHEMNLHIYTEAKIKYKVNDTIKTTTPVSVPKSPDNTDTTTNRVTNKYLVSTLPSISLAYEGVVSVPGSSYPHLLLDINAKGLEHEGMISMLVILTQDGDSINPEGEHMMYLFPSSGASFEYINQVTITGGAGADLRLGAGDTYEASPVSISGHSTSTHSASATLTMGTLNTDGRFGLSTLRLPSSSVSGFKDGSVANYLLIATHRRGTDTAVGSFTYNAPVSVNGVPNITTNGGNYFLNFNLSSL